MIEFLIRLNPRLIIRYSKNSIDENLFRIALKSGYIIKEKDLQENKLFCNNDFVMRQAIKVNPNFIKYYLGKDKSLIDEAISLGYKPNLDDLHNNSNLNSFNYIKYLVKNNHPEAILYIQDSLIEEVFFIVDINKEVEDLIIFALEKYQPSLEEIEKHEDWCKSFNIMQILVEQNPEAFKLCKLDWEGGFSQSGAKELFEESLKKGYHPNLDDIKKNDQLKSLDILFEVIINESTDLEEIAECIRNYSGSSSEIIQLSIDKGYEPNEEDVYQNDSLSRNYAFMEALIYKDPTTILLYTGGNQDLFELAYDLIPDKDFFKEKVMEEKASSNLQHSSFIMKKLIEEDENFIDYYLGGDLEVIRLAINKDYVPTEKFVQRYQYDEGVKSLLIEKKMKEGYIPTTEEMEMMARNRFAIDLDKYIPAFMDEKPEYIRFYTGDDEAVIFKAANAGYLPPEEIAKKILKDFATNVETSAAMVKLNPDLLDYCHESKKLPVKIITTGYIPTMEELESSGITFHSYEVMKKLLAVNHDYIRYMNSNLDPLEKRMELYELAIDSDYIIELVESEKDADLLASDKIMSTLIKRDSRYLKKYAGNNIDVFKLAIRCNYVPEDNNSGKELKEEENDDIVRLIQTKDFERLKAEEETIANKKIRLFEIALKMGYLPSINNINNNNFILLNNQILEEILKSSSREEIINLLLRIEFELLQITDETTKIIIKYANLDIPLEYVQLIKHYSNDKSKFLEHYNDFHEFLLGSNISEDVFVQYMLGSEQDWLSDILRVREKEKEEEFNRVKDYFFKEYYQKENGEMNAAVNMKAFVNILKNYVKYPELCESIMRNNTPLTTEIIEKLDFLFENNEVLDEENRPKSIEDLENIEEYFAKKYLQELSDIESMDIDEIKAIICRQLFNDDLDGTKRKLNTYGNTEDLRQLLFDNRDNTEMHSQIEEMMIYTSIMEAIIDADDKEYLIEMSKRINDNFKLSARCMMLFTRFNEKMQSLYSNDLSVNLTQLKEGISKEALLDHKKSEEYGVEVIDFSDRVYCLLAHTKSSKETVDSLVHGKASGKSNFISFAAISNRNQIYYSQSDIIFGYDSLPEGAFVLSSVSNLGTNGLIGSNSTDVEDSNRNQRGIIKTSSTTRGNSEVLCFREGIRPRYIILPGGREPTQEEIKIAQEYGLKFAITQKISETIDSPKPISDDLLESKRDSEKVTEKLESLRALRNELVSKKKGPRKIAIFTDAHALFEPTLAILEDARKRGITEIYSLGDNIGTGPNPRQVMELLDEYGVESLAGNHELYAAFGVDQFKEHLQRTNSYDSAEKNSSWTKTQLTPEQLERIRTLPEERIVEIGGETILLTHFVRDYNSEEEKAVSDDISHVFQGHVHFEKEDDKITTIRGAGIGDYENKNKAVYIILTEKADGGYEVERQEVDFDYNSLRHDIMLSDMFESDKEKIEKWVGVSK